MTPSTRLAAAAPWLALALVVLGLGGLSAILLRAKLGEDLALAREQAAQRSAILTSVLAASLQGGRYQNLDGLIVNLGNSDSAILELRLTAANGFPLGEYRGPSVSSEHDVVLESRIPYSYRSEARLRLRVDLGPVYERHRALVGRLAVIFVAFAAALIALLHLALRRQREAQRLRQRTQELDAARNAVAVSEGRLRAIIETEPECVKIVGPDGSLREMNAAGIAMLEAGSLAEVQKRKLGEYLLPDHREAFAALHRRVMQGADGTLQFEVEGLKGTRRWLETHAAPLRDARGNVTGLLGITRDVTERRQAEEKIHGLNRVYAVLSSINQLIVRVSDRGELYRETCRIAHELGRFPIAWIGEVNRAARRVELTEVQGTDRSFFASVRAGIDERAPEGLGVIGLAVKSGAPVISNDVASDPRVRAKPAFRSGPGSLVVLPLAVGGAPVAVLVLHSKIPGFFDEEEMKLLHELAADISFALEHIEKSSRLNYLAYYDALTGLANRTLFQDRFSQHLRAAQQENEALALVLVDIERFKGINDSLGRDAGDELLRQVAARLERATDPASIARLGSDQFAIILPATSWRAEVLHILETIWRECFTAPFTVHGTELRIAARAGIALFPEDGASAEALLANAEAALKKAAESGERHQFHSREMTERIAEQFSLENKLRRALDNHQFALHYQTKIDCQTRRIVGLEALLRWDSPELGLVPPAKFIPLLEQTGLILDVGAWALATAVQDHLRWLKRGIAAPRIAVNVSPIQLRRQDFVAVVERALKPGAPVPGIDLEITESLVMENIQDKIGKLKALRELGLNVVIDDFGTGYSSLAYLAKLPVQSLKIDRSFIVSMLADRDTMTLVRTIISLAHSLRLKVVAEGVDAEEQAEALRGLTCDELQGFLFSPPLPFAQVTELLGEVAGARP